MTKKEAFQFIQWVEYKLDTAIDEIRGDLPKEMIQGKSPAGRNFYPCLEPLYGLLLEFPTDEEMKEKFLEELISSTNISTN